MDKTLIKNTINWSPMHLVLTPLVLACFGLSVISAHADEAIVPGFGNTAEGFQALNSNTTGSSNTADGRQALFSNTTSSFNTADGYQALFHNAGGAENTADGVQALFFNTTGRNNTASGFRALFHNTTGSNNIALGWEDGRNLTTGSNNIDIGNAGVAGESGTIRIGSEGPAHTRAFIAGVSGVAVSGATVVINSSDQLGVAPSSRRFKDEIKPMDEASEAIFALKPVTFRYKKELDPGGTPQFGLVAEEVEKVNSDLVARDANGDAYTVRYEAVNAMLLNELLKEHRKVQEQDATIAELKSMMAQQQNGMEVLAANLKDQASQLQKVSAHLEVSSPRPAPEMVLNNQ
jgi:trimeric autotransporter adhesin